jgi:hypothetical protein
MEGADARRTMPSIGRYLIGTFGLLAVTFFASSHLGILYIWVAFLMVLVALIAFGAVRRAPTRNVLFAVPSVVFSSLYVYSRHVNFIEDVSWGVLLFIILLLCGVAYILLDYRDQGNSGSSGDGSSG